MSLRGWLIKGAAAVGAYFVGKGVANHNPTVKAAMDTLDVGLQQIPRVASLAVEGFNGPPPTTASSSAAPATPAPATSPGTPSAAPAAPAAEGAGWGIIKKIASKSFGFAEDHPLMTAIGGLAVLTRVPGIGPGIQSLLFSPFGIAVMAGIGILSAINPGIGRAIGGVLENMVGKVAGKGRELAEPSQAVQIEITSGPAGHEKKTTVDINSADFKKAMEDAKTLSVDGTFKATYKGETVDVKFNEPESMKAFYTKLNDWEKGTHPTLSRPLLKVVEDATTSPPKVKLVDLNDPIATMKLLEEAMGNAGTLQVMEKGKVKTIDVRTIEDFREFFRINAAERSVDDVVKAPMEGWRSTVSRSELFANLETLGKGRKTPAESSPAEAPAIETAYRESEALAGPLVNATEAAKKLRIDGAQIPEPKMRRGMDIANIG